MNRDGAPDKPDGGGRRCGGDRWCLCALRSRLLTHVVPQIPALPPSAGTRCKRTPGDCVFRPNGVQRRQSTPTRRSPDASVDFNQTKSKINECPQTKSARGLSGRRCSGDLWCLLVFRSRLLTHVVPQIPALPPSAGTHCKRTPGDCVFRPNGVQTRQSTSTRRSPDASVDFNQTESKGNECPQTKSAERVASGVHLRADRSTPDARGSADSGVASICGNSLHADSGRGHADEFRSSDHHGSASPARTARKRAATASSGSTPLEAIDSAVAERSSARGRAFGFREPSSMARR